MITKCLKAGKHVLSEKPVADTVKRAKQLIKEYEGEYQGQGLVWEVAEREFHCNRINKRIAWISADVIPFKRILP